MIKQKDNSFFNQIQLQRLRHRSNQFYHFMCLSLKELINLLLRFQQFSYCLKSYYLLNYDCSVVAGQFSVLNLNCFAFCFCSDLHFIFDCFCCSNQLVQNRLELSTECFPICYRYFNCCLQQFFIHYWSYCFLSQLDHLLLSLKRSHFGICQKEFIPLLSYHLYCSVHQKPHDCSSNQMQLGFVDFVVEQSLQYQFELILKQVNVVEQECFNLIDSFLNCFYCFIRFFGELLLSFSFFLDLSMFKINFDDFFGNFHLIYRHLYFYFLSNFDFFRLICLFLHPHYCLFVFLVCVYSFFDFYLACIIFHQNIDLPLKNVLILVYLFFLYHQGFFLLNHFLIYALLTLYDLRSINHLHYFHLDICEILFHDYDVWIFLLSSLNRLKQQQQLLNWQCMWSILIPIRILLSFLINLIIKSSHLLIYIVGN